MELLASIWSVLAQMAPWLLGGFLLAGVISVVMPTKWVSSAMGGARGWRGVLNAVLIGIPLPVCSCGVLPLATGLRKAGAGRGAVSGFLISTPQTGVDSVLATYALLGPVFALARPIAAFATGLIGGIAVDLSGVRDAEAVTPATKPPCHCCCCHKTAAPANESPVVVRILRKAFIELFGEIARPLAVGLLVAAIVTLLVPADFFASAFGGNDWILMPLMVLVGFPMYVCSTASIPVAASLMMKGISPGAALVFLMVGPAINAASIAAVSKLIGRRATVVYAAVIAVGAIACGIALNAIPFDVTPRVEACCNIEHVSLAKHFAAAALTALMAFHFVRSAALKRRCGNPSVQKGDF